MASDARRVFMRDLTDGAHGRRFNVEKTPTDGWRIRDERDSKVVRNVTYDDWHRVELAIKGFSAEAAQLKRHGWHDR